MVKKFDLTLLHAILAPLMPMVVIGEELITLSTLEHAIANNDGSLELYFISGREIVLKSENAQKMADILKRGIEQVQQMQAAQAARQLGIITH